MIINNSSSHQYVENAMSYNKLIMLFALHWVRNGQYVKNVSTPKSNK